MSERMITTQDPGTEEDLTLFQDAGGRLYVDDERIWEVSALGDGISSGAGSRLTARCASGSTRSLRHTTAWAGLGSTT
jgi:hypothetical protein